MAITTNDAPSTVLIETGEHHGRRQDAPTVLFVDAAGSSAYSNNDGVESGEINSRKIEQAATLLPRYRGTILKTVGDSLLAEFPDPVSAVRAGIEIERLVEHRNLAFPREKQLDLRIGIHASTGSSSGMDMFGDAVNWAVGIAKHADAGQILVSGSVYESVSHEQDLHFQWIGKSGIQGRDAEQDVFEVSWAEAPSNIPARFKVLSQIGKGGMGVVYKVQDLETDEIMALKVLKPETSSDPAMQENLRREVCLARKVTHKNVCRIHDFNRANGTACISMEFVEGESLACTLRRSGAMPANQAVEIGRQICAGLREAHLQGIVHRDLKPANILMDRTGSVKIMDFGIARLVRDNSEMTGTISGTPAYMAPEQIELKSIDARTDIYAVGLLLYEIVAGRPAFSGENPIAVAIKQIRDLPTRPREIVPALSGHTESIILKCLQKDPAGRFQSVDQLDLALSREHEVETPLHSKISIPPQLQQAALKAQQLLVVARKEAGPALSWCAAELQRHSLTSLRIVRGFVQKAKTSVQRRDWLALTRMRSQQALAGLGLVLVLGCVIAFALGRNGKSATLPHAVASASRQSLPTLPIQTRRPNNARRVDLTRASGSAKATLALRPRAASANHSRTSAPDASLAALNAITTVVAKSAPLDVDSLPLATTLEPTEPTNEPKQVVLKPGAPVFFLEVGSFKDAPWADNAVERLSQFGFHAISVQKGHLWAQSYHVQVGPYASPKDIEDAEETLASHGFKSHVVK